MHPVERVEVRDGVTVGPGLARCQQEILKGVLQGRGQCLQLLFVYGLAIRQRGLLAHFAYAPLRCRAVVLCSGFVFALACALLR